MSNSNSLFAQALAGVADLAAKYDSDGVDVYFLNHPRFSMDLKVDGELKLVSHKSLLIQPVNTCRMAKLSGSCSTQSFLKVNTYLIALKPT